MIMKDKVLLNLMVATSHETLEQDIMTRIISIFVAKLIIYIVKMATFYFNKLRAAYGNNNSGLARAVKSLIDKIKRKKRPQFGPNLQGAQFGPEPEPSRRRRRRRSGRSRRRKGRKSRRPSRRRRSRKGRKGRKGRRRR